MCHFGVGWVGWTEDIAMMVITMHCYHHLHHNNAGAMCHFGIGLRDYFARRTLHPEKMLTLPPSSWNFDKPQFDLNNTVIIVIITNQGGRKHTTASKGPSTLVRSPSVCQMTENEH